MSYLDLIFHCQIEQFLSDIYEGVHLLKKDPMIAHAQAQQGDINSILSWLTALGLEEYESMFLLNGFEKINFISGGILEESDLIEMMMYNADHRRYDMSRFSCN